MAPAAEDADAVGDATESKTQRELRKIDEAREKREKRVADGDEIGFE